MKGLMMTIKLQYILYPQVILLLSSAVIADEYLWDQSTYMHKPNGPYLSIDWFSPIGQEFTPNMTSLEVVQLEIHSIEFPAEYSVNIYSDSITGYLIGSSYITTLPANFEGTATFLFEPLLLQPQCLYVLELKSHTAQMNPAVQASYAPYYLSGMGVLFGTPDEEIDLYFREGVIDENTLERLSWASIKNLSW